MPNDGFLGWVAAQQRAFYQALTAALGQLKSGANAFWVLGGLSLLYGIFHAAGPGHGKVVISSYVLANEAQAARGIALSFAAAMMQAVTAVVFILVAAGLLQATSLVISGVATWVAIASYALVALLGLWLVARKLAGWGHSHGRHDHHDHAPGHDHHHVVGPQKRNANWQEMLGVVLAVGLRPCSGALVVLVFSLSQGVLLAGIAATFLMALGTGLTVAVLATLAVFAKGAAMRIGGNGVLAGRIVWTLELLGALGVFAFGVVLLLASFV
jgi:ABC-type nickel/cobalt efflux system permease component RcnA